MSAGAGQKTTGEWRDIQKMNPVFDKLRMDQYLQAVLGGPAQIGQIFYIDPTSGSDSWDGSSPTRAKATSQAAIDLCVANRGDVVIRMRGGEAVTSTVTFDCAGMTYITEGYGMNPIASGEYFSIYSTTLTSAPTATVTADGVTIAGVAFVGVDATATFFGGAALLIGGLATAAPFGARITGCRFPKWNIANRIGLAIEGSSDCKIDHCGFEGVGADFDSGIYVQGACANLEISDNQFRDCTYGILCGAFAGGGPDAIIKSNIFHDSKALSAGVASAANPIMFADNWVNGATDSGSYNDTVNNLNTGGVVFSDNHYAE